MSVVARICCKDVSCCKDSLEGVVARMSAHLGSCMLGMLGEQDLFATSFVNSARACVHEN